MKCERKLPGGALPNPGNATTIAQCRSFAPDIPLEVAMQLRRIVFASLLSLVVPMLATTSAFAAFPDKPVKIIVPFAAGGTSDIIARLLTKPLSDALGVPVIVDNKVVPKNDPAPKIVDH
jgi:hypothetical protein